MLELGAGADIFHGLGWLYVGLITILVGASLWFAFLLWREKSWARKSVVYILRLGMWAAAGSVDTDLSFLSFLELYRTDVAQRRMAPGRVVEPLDVIEDVSTSLLPGPVYLPSRSLCLQ